VSEPRLFSRLVVRPYARRLVVATLAALVATAAALAQPMGMQWLLDAVNTNEDFGHAVVFLVIVTIVEAMAVGAQTYLLYSVGANAVAHIRTTLIGTILKWPMSRYAETGRGTLTTVVTADTARMHSLVARGVFQMFTAALLTGGAIVFMFTINLLLTMVTLGVVVFATLVVLLATNSVRQDSRTAQERASVLADRLSGTLGAIRTFRASGAVSAQEQAMNVEVEEARVATHRIGRRLSWVTPLSSLVIQIAFVTVLGLGGAMAYAGDVSLSELVAFLMYLMLLLVPIEGGLGALSGLQETLGSWDRVKQLLEHGKVMRDPHGVAVDDLAPIATVIGASTVLESAAVTTEEPTSRTAGRDLRAPHLAFRNVSLAHGSKLVLDDVNITIPAGAVTALWGPSGTGKSTMMDALAGLLEPHTGEVWVDGTRRATAQPSSYLEQRAPIVGGTLRNNLLLGAPNADDAMMMDALTRVGLWYLAGRSGLGLGATVGDEGLSISGGEAQRLALARILLNPQPLILLDEPTARADTATEVLIHDVIRSLARDHTVVLATHREATRALCDHVIEFSAIDQGIHGTRTLETASPRDSFVYNAKKELP
jgi:ABC-type multidrug transport system fused ATPase/permease subunit